MYTIFQRVVAIVLIFVFLPFLGMLYICIKITSKGPFIFKQKRYGKDKKVFDIYKIRTMYDGAENDRKYLIHRNERTSPLFKISNDPRYTSIGKILAFTGLDEIPQLINIIIGDMTFIGPRPYSIEVAEQISQKYSHRYSVLPGIISPYEIKTKMTHDFVDNMEEDLKYIKNRNIIVDSKIVILLIILTAKRLAKILIHL